MHNMSIFDPDVPLDEAAAMAEFAARNQTPAQLARGDQLIAMANEHEATVTLPLNDWGAIIALMLASSTDELLTPDGEARIEAAYRRLVEQVGPVSELAFSPGGGERFHAVLDRFREDLTDDESIAAMKILAQQVVPFSLAYWEWAAIAAAVEAVEPIMPLVSPNGGMSADVMPIVAKINAHLESLGSPPIPRAVIDQLEASGYLKGATNG
jgi:hypothetical protein